MAIDPITAMLWMQTAQTVINFPFVRRQQKQTLQKLHTNRLIAQLNGESTANQINDIAEETLANNLTVASTGGYAPMDSASFEAIQDRVNTQRDTAYRQKSLRIIRTILACMVCMRYISLRALARARRTHGRAQDIPYTRPGPQTTNWD